MPAADGSFKGISVPAWTDWRTIAEQRGAELEELRKSHASLARAAFHLWQRMPEELRDELMLDADALMAEMRVNPEGDH